VETDRFDLSRCDKRNKLAAGSRPGLRPASAVVKGNGKGHTLYIAPLGEGTSQKKRSGIARVVEGFHSFTCILTRLSTNGMNHTCLCLSSRSWSHLPTPEVWKAELAWAPPRRVNSLPKTQDRYVTAITVVSCSSRRTSLGKSLVEFTLSELTQSARIILCNETLHSWSDPLHIWRLAEVEISCSCRFLEALTKTMQK